MTYSQAGQLPAHQYALVDQAYISSKQGFAPCIWFGLVSIPGRAWGCTIMLECGAVYRGRYFADGWRYGPPRRFCPKAVAG